MSYLYTWCQMTVLPDVVTPDVLLRAVEDFRRNGETVAWVLDASKTVSYDFSIIREIEKFLAELATRKLRYVVFVHPSLFVSFALAGIQKPKHVKIHSVVSMDDARCWLERGCP